MNLAVQRFTANGIQARSWALGFHSSDMSGRAAASALRARTGARNRACPRSTTSLFIRKYPQRTYGWDPRPASRMKKTFQFVPHLDNAQSITDKINYVKTNNLGGWGSIWNIMNDYIPGRTPANPLLTAVRNALGTTSTVTAPTITTASLAAGTVAVGYFQDTRRRRNSSFTWAITAGALPGGLLGSVRSNHLGNPRRRPAASHSRPARRKPPAAIRGNSP